MREAMFDKTNKMSLLNTESAIYQEIAKIAGVMRANEPLRFGRMYYREISVGGGSFGMPYGSEYTLAFSRMLYGSEVLVAYNVSGVKRTDSVIVDATLHAKGSTMTYLYGGKGTVEVQEASGARFVTLPLAGYQFVVLR